MSLVANLYLELVSERDGAERFSALAVFIADTSHLTRKLVELQRKKEDSGPGASSAEVDLLRDQIHRIELAL